MTGVAAIERLKRVVIARTGHYYYSDKDKLLYERSRERMQAKGIPTLEAYVDLLELGDGDEWRRLEDAITIGETYFFRYPDHFATLRESVLPRLIKARAEEKALRIWSIGCSNGAEPYSIAIVLRELLGSEAESWRVAIIGGDLSEKALSAARSARFNNWALRTMPPEERVRYFHQGGAHWVLKREYRTMVRFERQNILDLLSPTPPLEWSGFDLILCRNVLIYFSPAQALEIVDALSARLASDGALFLGHAEATLTSNAALRDSFLSGLPTECAQAVKPMDPQVYVPPVVPPLPLSLARVEVPPRQVRRAEEDDVARLQQLADAGAYEEAQRLCDALLQTEPTSARLHYFDAILRQVSDDPKGAEASLRRAVYLDRSFIVAHHRLALLLAGLGRVVDARRSLQTVIRLAGAMNPMQALPEGHGISAREIAEAARSQLVALGEAA